MLLVKGLKTSTGGYLGVAASVAQCHLAKKAIQTSRRLGVCGRRRGVGQGAASGGCAASRDGLERGDRYEQVRFFNKTGCITDEGLALKGFEESLIKA